MSRLRRAAILATALGIGTLAGGCAGGQATSSGHLVIVGGGLKRENAAVYRRILELGGPGATVAVLPTASGVPEEVGPDYAADFIRHGGGAAAGVIPLSAAEPDAADDPAIAAEIARHRIIFFTGGDETRVLSVLRPDGHRTEADRALFDVLEDGGVIAGTSAGAAIMSDPMIRWGRSDEALLIGTCAVEERGVATAPGMGYFPFGIVGQHFLSRGNLGQMIAALESEHLPIGYGIDENRALVVDLGTGTIETMGEQALLLVDMTRATRDGLARRDIRLSLLGGGDTVDAESGRATPAKGKIPFVLASDALTSAPDFDNAFAPYVIADLIEELATSRATEGQALAEHFRLVVTEDDRTRFYSAPDGMWDTITAIDVRLDVIPLPGAERAAQELRREIEFSSRGVAMAP